MLRKIVLIDDSEAVNDRNEILLDSMNVSQQIVKHSNPLKALSSIKDDYQKDSSDYPDIIFLDLAMPEIDGFDFLDQYSDWETKIHWERKPVIIIVSDYLLEDRNLDQTNHYKSSGVLDHLKKPIDEEDVKMVLEEYFEEFDFDVIIFSEIKLPLKPFKKLLPNFFREVKEDFDDLKDATAKNNLVDVRLLAHKIKGVSASFYAVLQSEKALLIQESIENKKIDNLQQLVADLEEAITLSYRYAQQHLNV